MSSIPYRPDPTPPKMTSPVIMLVSGTLPPMPVYESWAELTEPFEASVVTVAQSALLAMPKRCSLPSRLPPVVPSAEATATCGGLLGRRAVLLGGVGHHHAGHEHRGHRRVERPALAAVAHHAPERRGQRGGDEQDEQHLDEVRERGRVLERHRAVHVEEAAAVGAQLLDRDLRGGRAEREGLVGALEGRVGHVAAERLDHALRDEHERPDEGERQQDVEQRAGEVLPEVAELLRAAAREAADHGGQHRHADRRGHEVLHRQPRHLREVGERRLAAVELPVRVGDERRGGVEAHVPGARVEALGVEGVDPLGAEDHEQHHEEEGAEHERRAPRSPSSPAAGPGRCGAAR